MERTVEVWDERYVVEIDQRSKTVWVATGEYMGKPITVKGRTASAALKLWRETARYRGNG